LLDIEFQFLLLEPLLELMLEKLLLLPLEPPLLPPWPCPARATPVAARTRANAATDMVNRFIGNSSLQSQHLGVRDLPGIQGRRAFSSFPCFPRHPLVPGTFASVTDGEQLFFMGVHLS
jgi:hypothetical protein